MFIFNLFLRRKKRRKKENRFISGNHFMKKMSSYPFIFWDRRIALISNFRDLQLKQIDSSRHTLLWLNLFRYSWGRRSWFRFSYAESMKNRNNAIRYFSVHSFRITKHLKARVAFHLRDFRPCSSRSSTWASSRSGSERQGSSSSSPSSLALAPRPMTPLCVPSGWSVGCGVWSCPIWSTSAIGSWPDLL